MQLPQPGLKLFEPKFDAESKSSQIRNEQGTINFKFENAQTKIKQEDVYAILYLISRVYY